MSHLKHRPVITFAAALVGSALHCAPAIADEGPVVTTDARPTGQQVVHFGTWGVDLSSRDLSIKPGDDFQRYASGEWMRTHEIPSDKSQNGVGSELSDRNQEQLQTIILGAPASSLLGALYTSYMDEDRLEALDAAPLHSELARVAAIASKADFTRFMAGTPGGLGATLFGVGVLPDLARPDTNIGGIFSSGMGMPDRDYYLTDKYSAQRAAYRAYVERTFELIGEADAAKAADQVLAFETQIAELSWSQTDLRDLEKLNKSDEPRPID